MCFAFLKYTIWTYWCSDIYLFFPKKTKVTFQYFIDGILIKKKKHFCGSFAETCYVFWLQYVPLIVKHFGGSDRFGSSNQNHMPFLLIDKAALIKKRKTSSHIGIKATTWNRQTLAPPCINIILVLYPKNKTFSGWH